MASNGVDIPFLVFCCSYTHNVEVRLLAQLCFTEQIELTMMSKLIAMATTQMVKDTLFLTV